jgi:integrase
MPKATLMVRFRRPADPNWMRRPAVYGSTGRVQPGVAEFRNADTGQRSAQAIGKNYSYEIRVEDGRTTYKPAGRNGADAEALRLRIMARFAARAQCEAAGLLVIDPAEEEKKRPRLKDTFDDYIEDALKRGALEAREQAILIKAQFLKFIPIVYVDEVNRNRILSFDAALREHGSSGRTLFNKRQRLQSMLRWAGVDPKIFPPKPKYEKKLPTIYTPDQLAGLFRVATPYERTVCNLALKLGLRDQEVRFAEYTDISWHESVFRVRSKPQYGFTVKDYEQRDIPIPLDLLEELRAWKEAHPGQNLIVPTPKGKPNDKLLRMVKGMARRAGIECGWCENCLAGVKGDRGCSEFELHKFRRTCITTWLRSNNIDPRTVMEYAGHADLETTLRYLRPAAAAERIAAVSEIKWY